MKNESEFVKVAVFIDGFNLYFGMVQADYQHCKWLDVVALSESFLKPNQQLVFTRYFTSRVSNNAEKQKRQGTFLEAIEACGAQIKYGKFQTVNVDCKRCLASWKEANEKMTDVNIATDLLVEAIKDSYDVAILVTGDSDLVPAINAIHELFPKKRVVVAFPPKRENNSVKNASKGHFIIGRRTLEKAQMPDFVESKTGYQLSKPTEWK